MLGGLRLAYSAVKNAQNEVLLRPLLPLTLSYQGKSVEINGLIDTGADVNVLPYSVGIALGAEWDKQNIAVQLSGNLAMQPAKGIILIAHIGTFAPVKCSTNTLCKLSMSSLSAKITAKQANIHRSFCSAVTLSWLMLTL
jgi:predicted aspartyl protease